MPDDDTAALMWLFATARRVLANHHRGRRRRLALADRLRDTLSVAASAAATLDPHSTVHDALARLRPEDQELLRLDAWEDLSSEQIAAVLDITPAAARKRLQRARRRLADALDSTDKDLS